MPRLTPVHRKRLECVFLSLGFKFHRQKGSHRAYVKPGINPYQDITNYNNFYEFSEGKEAVAMLSTGFRSDPWSVEVGGLVSKPRTFAMEELLKMFPQEDRIYRLRCVEAWSMVIPWRGFPLASLLKKFPQEERIYRLRCVEAWSMVISWNGFPLASLLKEVEPTSDAKFVRFETVYRPDEMPGQKSPFYPWPYQEGLRLDEAMHDLTILATGLYGLPMPNQNGAPIRLVIPWKYGFKSIKSIVKIELVAEQPDTLWSSVGPNEYGFYSNVNPERPHPRWSQASERRIGELQRRPTLMFNGYAEEVASLYNGMDLDENF